MWRWCQVQPSRKERAIGAVHCKNEGIVEFVLAPQHEMFCDAEKKRKEDFDYWRKITKESNLEVYRRIQDKPNEAEN